MLLVTYWQVQHPILLTNTVLLHTQEEIESFLEAIQQQDVEDEPKTPPSKRKAAGKAESQPQAKSQKKASTPGDCREDACAMGTLSLCMQHSIVLSSYATALHFMSQKSQVRLYGMTRSHE